MLRILLAILVGTLGGLVGGALGIGMGNIIGMCSGGYFGVISPEGAASILGRYDNDAHKAQQFTIEVEKKINNVMEEEDVCELCGS